MIFSDPRWLMALAVLPVVAALEWLAARRAHARLGQLVGERTDHALLVQRVPGDRRLGAVLRLGALALLVIGAAGPEWGREMVRRGATGSDVVMIMDVSASMDARDVPPSRLDEARREALAVIDRLEGSRVGVVAFAGDAVRLCPLTLDRGAARLVVEGLSSGSVSTPGTDLGRALRTGLKLMPRGRREEQALVLWTDGEDLEAGARGALDEVAGSGVRVFAVGVGTPAGDVIPVRDAQGRVTDVKRDAQGLAVRSRLDEDLLRTIARRTHGAYFGAQRPGGELERLLSAIDALARSSRGERLVERPVARFTWCAALAALLIVADLGRPRRRRDAAARAETSLHSEGRAAAAAALLLLLSALLQAGDARAQSAWARGNHAFLAGRYVEAESLYAKRLRRGGPEAVRVNEATARALSGSGGDVTDALRPLAAGGGQAALEAGYNLGTVLGREDRYDDALAALRRVLERNPADADARWNYEVLLRRRQEERKRPPQQDQNPEPQGGGGGGGSSQPQPPPQAPAQPAPQQGAPPPPPGPQSASGMTRAQADRLLSALREMARNEQGRRRRVPVTRDRHERDW